MLHLLRDLIKDTLLRIEDEKKTPPCGIKTHDISVTRRVLYS
jgi:hypothetical protein